jgi:hypothetical protein
MVLLEVERRLLHEARTGPEVSSGEQLIRFADQPNADNN